MGTSPPCSLTFFLASRTHLSRVFASTSIGGLFNEQISWNLLFPVTGDVGLGGDVESRGHEVARGVKHDLLPLFHANIARTVAHGKILVGVELNSQVLTLIFHVQAGIHGVTALPQHLAVAICKDHTTVDESLKMLLFSSHGLVGHVHTPFFKDH